MHGKPPPPNPDQQTAINILGNSIQAFMRADGLVNTDGSLASLALSDPSGNLVLKMPPSLMGFVERGDAVLVIISCVKITIPEGDTKPGILIPAKAN